ncbi:SDR family NAD(P)-dependent oxidoreductase [Protaetiibacter larvae]|nr:SDR family NAD(P)-dependent oxidoreductase [Protaetiibacter larvae]
MTRHAVVTGGTAGIGRELVAQLIEDGWEVHCCGRSRAALDELAAHPRVHATPLELRDAHATAAWAEQLERATDGRIGLLLLNAGVQHEGPHERRTPASIADEVAVNLTAPALLTARLWRALRAADGAVVFVSSGLALVPRTDAALYSATKAALSSFATALRRRPERGVAVTDVLLPMVDTAMTAGRGDGGKLQAREAARAILAAARADRRVGIGRARALPALAWAAPWLARRVIR